MFNSSAFRAKLDKLRSIPGRQGLRPYHIYLDTITTTADLLNIGESTEVIVTTELLVDGYAPACSQVTQEDVLAGGCESQDLMIRMTPEFLTGGLALSSVRPAVSETAGKTLRIRITGEGFPSGASYTIIGVNSISALHTTITIRKNG